MTPPQFAREGGLPVSGKKSITIEEYLARFRDLKPLDLPFGKPCEQIFSHWCRKKWQGGTVLGLFQPGKSTFLVESTLPCEVCGLAWFVSWIEFPDGTSRYVCSGDCLHDLYCEWLHSDAAKQRQEEPGPDLSVDQGLIIEWNGGWDGVKQSDFTRGWYY